MDHRVVETLFLLFMEKYVSNRGDCQEKNNFNMYSYPTIRQFHSLVSVYSVQTKSIHTEAYSSFIHCCQNLKEAKMSFKRWKNQWTVIYSDNEMVSNHEKTWRNPQCLLLSERINLKRLHKWVQLHDTLQKANSENGDIIRFF